MTRCNTCGSPDHETEGHTIACDHIMSCASAEIPHAYDQQVHMAVKSWLDNHARKLEQAERARDDARADHRRSMHAAIVQRERLARALELLRQVDMVPSTEWADARAGLIAAHHADSTRIEPETTNNCRKRGYGPLRALRNKAGLTVDELAARAQVGRQTIIRAEARGGWPGRPAMCAAVQRALGM